ncbi:tetratricopeptide repeat protein [Leptolyngbya sp. GB1-A1]|uniref:tetratricopeptide repeat protein n=1 Tax=Leptolyngbya sp. GB1-A1 TaxID=2933908 RepID=UPI0032970304
MRLDTIFRSSSGAVISAIAGMGGIGKTQLAAKYVRDYQQAFPGGICWLNGRAGDLATQVVLKAELELHLKGLDAVKEQLVQPDAIAQWCWRHWQPEAGRVLIVLDDVTDWANCRAAVPTGDRFRILVTTRQQNLLPHYETVALDVLQPQEARSLLASLEKFGRVEQDLAIADQLCAALGHLPLAIELVGCYLANDPYLTLAETIANLQAKGMQDPALERPESYEIVAQRGVKAAFELTWATLEPQAQKVARLLSYFALDWIDWDLAQWVMQAVEGEDYTLGGWKARLVNASLIEIEPKQPQWCRLHPLIQQFLQEEEAIVVQEVGAAPLRGAFLKRMVAIARQMPTTPTTRDIEAFKGVIPHIRAIAEQHTAELEGSGLGWLFDALARFYEGQGLYAQAEVWYGECLSTVQVRFKGDHPQVAHSFNNLAALYQAQGRLDKAEPLYQQALEMNQRLFQGDRSTVALGLNNLAGLYQAQGRLDEAELLYQQALKMRQRLFEGDHPDIAQSLNNLAALYQAQGRLDEAEPIFQQALKINQHLFEGDHPAVAYSLNNLAALYKAQGRLDQTELLLQQALKMNQRLFEGDHPALASSLNNLATLYKTQGRLDEAEPLYQQALKMNQRLFEGDHPALASSLNNLAYLYHSQGRLDEAEPIYQQALKMNQRLFEGDHPALASSLNNLAYLYHSQGRLDEAEPIFQQVLQMRQRLFKGDHPQVALSLNNLAYLYQAQEQLDQAELLFQQALKMRQRLFKGDHPDVASSLNNLGVFYYEQGRVGQAESLLVQSLAMRKKILGANHRHTIATQRGLAIVRQAMRGN